MSAIATVQARALVSRLEQEARHGVEELGTQAAMDCAAILREARQAAWSRVRAAAAEKRRRIAEHCRSVEIECDGRRRASAFAEASRVAAEALAQLPAALGARWQDPGVRAGWCRAAVAAALDRLRGRDWSVEVAAGLTPDERAALERQAVAGGARIAGWSDAATVAGLRIGRSGTWVDATLERLLADRAALTAQLLAELAAEAPP